MPWEVRRPCAQQPGCCTLLPRSAGRGCLLLSSFCTWLPFIPGAIKPLKKVSVPLPRNDAFMKTGVCLPPRPRLLSVVFGFPLHAPPLPPGASGHHSPVLTSDTHDQTSPDTQGSGPLLMSGAELRAGSCRAAGARHALGPALSVTLKSAAGK